MCEKDLQIASQVETEIVQLYVFICFFLLCYNGVTVTQLKKYLDQEVSRKFNKASNNDRIKRRKKRNQ